MKPIDDSLPLENEESKLPVQPAPEPDCYPGNTQTAANTNLLPTTERERFIQLCRDLRTRAKGLAQETWGLRQHPALREEQARPWQHGEMIANATLAFRHLEDARMRLGKAIQHAEDGISCYDKGTQPAE